MRGSKVHTGQCERGHISRVSVQGKNLMYAINVPQRHIFLPKLGLYEIRLVEVLGVIQELALHICSI